jgi:type VI secretion system protein ImpL
VNLLSWFYTVRSNVGTYARTITARWLLGLIWALALAAIVWFHGAGLAFGDFRPFNTAERRLIAVCVILAAWIAYVIWLVAAKRRADAAAEAEFRDEGDESRYSSTTAQDEVAELRGRLREALVTMRKVTGGGRGYVYELPWYLVIGAPGSGKTSAIANSGVKFPLGEGSGREPAASAGGTHHFDWWFTEDAVLIDSAGRYTLPDSRVDRAGWAAFLKLLKRSRRLQPLNGVVVAIGVDELTDTTQDNRRSRGRAIRRRLRELEDAFGLRIPLYLIITKVDRLAGFASFFDRFSRRDREQPWGVTFKAAETDHADDDVVQRFPLEFDLLIQRLNDLLLERLQQEIDIERRSLVFGFPPQVALLKEAIEDVLAEIVSASKFEKAPRVRGVYMTSSVQTGAAIDKVMQSTAVSFGLPVPQQPPAADTARSYFLTRLLTSVVFGEAGLVAAGADARRRRRRVAKAAAAMAAVAILGLGAAWGMTYVRTLHQMSLITTRTADFTQTSSKIPVDDVADSDFRRVAETLDMLRDAAADFEAQDLAKSAAFGLSGQFDKVLSGYRSAYGRALNGFLLPRLLVRLQDRLAERPADRNQQFDSLKLYLMLGGQGPLDRDFAQASLHADWETLYPGESRAGLRRSLDGHVAALLADPIQSIALDEHLIDVMRKRISDLTATDRAFALVRMRADAQKLPVWRPVDKTGIGGGRLFVRISGKAMSDGIPGLLTRAGYFNAVLPPLREIDRRITEEDWVRGPGRQARASGDISGETLRLYRSEFEKAWRDLLGDIRIVRLTSLAQAADVLNGIASPDSSLKRLLAAVVADTDLQAPAENAQGDDAMRIRAVIASAGDISDLVTPPDPFKPLRDYMTGSRDGPARFADLLRTLDELYRQVNRAADGTSVTNTLLRVDGSLNEANERLLAEARRLPAPVDSWMAGLSTDISALAVGKSRAETAQLWRANNRQLCELAVDDHYPFKRTSPSDISIDDFSKLFGPNGQLDQFFRENLQPLVDTSSRPWRWRAAYGQTGETSESLDAFERAATIREAFFTAGGTSPSLNLEIKPIALDDQSTLVLLANGDQEVTYDHGPVRSYSMGWPANGSAHQARVSFQPSDAGSTLTRTGPWALFRLIDNGARKVVEDRVRVIFTLGSHNATFDVYSGSALNPLMLPALRDFRCPKEL